MTLDTSMPHLDDAYAQWVPVCDLAELLPERGVAALVHGAQVAIFRLVDDTVLAVAQRDPYSDAHVISRGIVGSRGTAPTVASPMYKQVWDLRDGSCLEPMGEEPIDLTAFAVLVRDGVVHIAVTPDAEADHQ